jgi:hypothetical protein
MLLQLIFHPQCPHSGSRRSCRYVTGPHSCDSFFDGCGKHFQGLDATALDFLTPFRDIIPTALSQYRETGKRRHLMLCHASTSLFHSYAHWLPPAKMMLVEFVPVIAALIVVPELQVGVV